MPPPSQPGASRASRWAIPVSIVLAGLLVASVVVWEWEAGHARTSPGGGNVSWTLTTLSSIVGGNFTSAVDKNGTGGSHVEVRHITATKITPEADGDWHVYVFDPTYDQFVTEVIPADQASVGEPPLNVSLTIWGITYCDVYHENESWHGYTCWEIHPLTGWQVE